MDDWEEGKQKFLELVRGIDADVQVVIPTKGPNRKFITVPEDDVIDLPGETSIVAKVTKTLQDAVGSL